MIADARAVALRWPAARQRVLAEFAVRVSEAPWTLTAAHRTAAREAGLSDDEVLHAVALAAYFGHLNRVADAVGVALDYEVMHRPPHAEPATPRLTVAPAVVRGEPALAIETRPATAAALAAWGAYIAGRTPENAQIAAWVAGMVGDGPPVASDGSSLRALVEDVTLAPWALGDAAFAALRAEGYDDARLFAICTAASSCNTFSRLRVALVALGR